MVFCVNKSKGVIITCRVLLKTGGLYPFFPYKFKPCHKFQEHIKFAQVSLMWPKCMCALCAIQLKSDVLKIDDRKF